VLAGIVTAEPIERRMPCSDQVSQASEGPSGEGGLAEGHHRELRRRVCQAPSVTTR
jgi:hypothetical protein